MGKMFLVVVDTHFKWLHVEIIPAATFQNTIHKLRSMFAPHDGYKQYIGYRLYKDAGA